MNSNRSIPRPLLSLRGLAVRVLGRLAPLSALAVSACVAVPPPPIAPPSALGPFAAVGSASPNPVPDAWWRLYDDPRLDALVEASLAANVDLEIARANLEGSRALARQAQALRLPQTTVESGVVEDVRSQPSAFAVPSTDWDLAPTASWDVDLFGRLRSGAAAAAADADAQTALVDSVRVAVAADTVLAYAEFCGFTRAVKVARDVATSQDQLVVLVRGQLQEGDVSPLEVSQAATLAASVRATIAPFEAQRMNALYRLATLQGRPPAEARGFSIRCPARPRLHRAAPIGDGAALLMRRPDIREAERRLAAAAARVGVAVADLYPRVNLGGALGLLSGGFAAVGTPLVTWAFPNQLPTRARIEQAEALERAALAGWDAVVLRALREVETALSIYDAEKRRNRHLATAVSEAQLYAERAGARVSLGDATGLLRFDARRTLATARLAWIQSELAIAQAEVALFRALGGGWRTGAAIR